MNNTRHVTERDAAGTFLQLAFDAIGHQWPAIRQAFEGTTYDAEKLVQDEFILAGISMELHALENLFSAEQATRLRGYVLELLHSWKPNSDEAIAEYDRGWADTGYLEDFDNPLMTLARTFAARSELRSVKIGEKTLNREFQFPGKFGTKIVVNPLFLMGIAEVLTAMPGIWKAMSSETVISDAM